jgi:hypothetical protein
MFYVNPEYASPRHALAGAILLGIAAVSGFASVVVKSESRIVRFSIRRCPAK